MKYKILEGFDTFNNYYLYRVEGIEESIQGIIENDYIGEWHKIREEAEEEMQFLNN
jgi:hypothetical protein